MGPGRSPSRRTFVQRSSTRSRHINIGFQAIHTYSTSAVIELTFQFLLTLLINFHFSIEGKLLLYILFICLYHCEYCLVPIERHHRSNANISYSVKGAQKPVSIRQTLEVCGSDFYTCLRSLFQTTGKFQLLLLLLLQLRLLVLL